MPDLDCCRTAISPVVWNVFVTIPLNSTTVGYLQQTLPQIAAAQAICLLTVEPMSGLDQVTATAVQQLAAIIDQYQKVCLGLLPAMLLSLQAICILARLLCLCITQIACL